MASLECHGKTDQRKASIRIEVTQQEKGKFNVAGSVGFSAVICSPYSIFFTHSVWGVSIRRMTFLIDGYL